MRIWQDNLNNQLRKNTHRKALYLTHLYTPIKMDEQSNNNNNNTTSMTELEMCKTALCFKEHELFALRADVQTQHAILQTLTQAFERMERTVAAGMDRLAHSVNRLGGKQREPSPVGYNNNKRRRRY